MAKNKNKFEKLNLKRLKIRLNFFSFLLIIIFYFFIISIFLVFVIKSSAENKNLILDKKNHIFNLYVSEIFKNISLLANSTEFIDYVRSGNLSRSNLNTQILNTFSHYLGKEIIGFSINDLNSVEMLFIGKKSNTKLKLTVCYLNDKTDYEYGRCSANLIIYFNKFLIFEKIKKIEPAVEECINCSPFYLKNGSIIDNLYVKEGDNFQIKYTITNNIFLSTTNFLFVSVLIILLLILFIFLINHWILNSYIFNPIKNLHEFIKNDSKKYNFKLSEIDEISSTIIKYKNFELLKFEVSKQLEISKIAVQVAHDIKSPILALNMFFEKEKIFLPEESRIIIRNSIQRIQDIANNLIFKHQESNKKNNDRLNNLSTHLVSSIIHSLVSEKRIQFRNLIDINIEEKFLHNSYGLFASIQINEFKTILSNLINNSVESFDEKKGNIYVTLNESDGKICISIEDNGKGIKSDLIPKIVEKGESFGKPNGNGLGLYHAKETLKSWGTFLEIESELMKGTKISIYLDKKPPPSWFVSEIEIQQDSILIIVDDDISIHNIWSERLKEINVSNNFFEVIHFTDPNLFIEWKNKLTENSSINKNKMYYLCDYEFINHPLNGIQIIENLGIKDSSILITSHFEDYNFTESCNLKKIKLIPKSLVHFVPIKIKLKEINIPKNIILIDDEEFIYNIWKLDKRFNNIYYFNDPYLFLSKMSHFEKSLPIFIDSCLGNNIKGEELAKEMYHYGFKEIYLNTNYPKEIFQEMYWIKKIINKDSSNYF
ncbi:HAMP domain-containing sensor histidine kinase [Pigmentibacter sp. JX0631]|uniref:sensor histidine kinase n=1 Tax=Pigmentibacter sp. JX0631 TaxID=2976982 RepID=UPI0024687D1F|nr:HAMP domain-containing sensor histidine kinase [Pigmentibacter sp. JX0631]WGL61176.1 HAMP domain-containing sensor histidine kinase [Pigmentibacter sp. JX0631]